MLISINKILNKMAVNKTKLTIIFFTIIFAITCFVRIYNINTTARFTRDESSDLVSMKRIIDLKKITLIGPMAEGDIGIFSSLTYYLSLPFVYILKFDPISPAIAASFYGIVTIILIWIFFKKQKYKWPFLFLLPIFLTPLVEGSRWAWNPHFIPFWQILGIIIFFSNIPFKLILTGLIFGLTIHHHWYAVFSCLGLIVFIYYQNKKIKDIFLYLTGLFFSITPFILFDITHPPGLFISRMLYFSPISTSNSSGVLNHLIKFINIPFQFTKYLSSYNQIFGGIVLFLSLFLFIQILLKKQKTNLFLFPIIFQFIGLSLISAPVSDRYLIPCVLFFILWLSQNLKFKTAKLIIILILTINIFSLPKILFKNDWTNNISALKKITYIIKDESTKNTNNPFNLVVLQSPDGNTKGTRFRDLLKVQNVYPLPPEDFQTPNTLFVISYGSWENIKDDPAYEMSNYRKKSPDNFWKIDNSKWFLYEINKQ